MHSDLGYTHPETVNRRWPVAMMKVLGGVLYVAGALIVMQFAFLLLAHIWT